MDISGIDDYDFSGKRVVLRGDLDVKVGTEVVENDRLRFLVDDVGKILDKGPAKIVLIGHRGRPPREGAGVLEFSLKPLKNYLSEKLGMEVGFVSGIEEAEGKVLLVENLRFFEGEEKNEEEFSKRISALGDLYVNDAFGSSHREHASIVGVPKFLPHLAGPHFLEEVKNLGRVIDKPKKPVVFVVSGAKEGKLDYLDDIKKRADRVLVGGLLPTLLPEDYKDEKVVLARLIADREDITINSAERFEEIIESAGTVVVSGPLGKFEEEGHRQGTKRVFEAVAKSGAFRVAGGGDTEAALELLDLKDGFDWVSTGGGAALHFLAKGTLPGIEALKQK